MAEDGETWRHVVRGWKRIRDVAVSLPRIFIKGKKTILEKLKAKQKSWFSAYAPIRVIKT